jgi:hypothetical protein
LNPTILAIACRPSRKMKGLCNINNWEIPESSFRAFASAP